MHAPPLPGVEAENSKLEVALRQRSGINVITLPITQEPPMRTFSLKNRAFSLLELIAVILIIGIIAAFVIPAMPTILRGTQMTQAEQILTDQVKLARQFAVTRNH